jgi:hypothetical protein
LLDIAIPAVSGRDHGLRVAAFPFLLGVTVFTFWTLIVPTTLAAGLLSDERRWRTRFCRLLAASLSVIWDIPATGLLLLPLSMALLALVLAHSPFTDSAQVVMTCVWGMLLLAIPLIPALWERKHADAAPFHLAMARSMITVYAVMALFFAVLVPVCGAYERHYVQIDQVMAPMNQGDDISVTMVEGRLVILLRAGVREGATTLGIPRR